MSGALTYDDGLIQLDRQAITLRRYHFPSGTSKVIPLRSVRGYQTESLGLVLNRFFPQSLQPALLRLPTADTLF